MPALKRVLATCGNGNFGRLGLGAECLSQSLPRIVGSLVGYDIKQVACGGAHTAVLTDDGTLLTFGVNDKGQLGHSETDKFIPVPIEVGLPEPVTAVAAGEKHTMCITQSGEVWAWGSNESAQLGIGPTDKFKIPEPRIVTTLTGKGITSLAAGSEHSLALNTDGQMWSWGTGATGATGQGSHAVTATEDMIWRPQRIRGRIEAAAVRSIAAGPYTSGAVDDAGRAWTWGNGMYWQLGHGADKNEPQPRQVAGLQNVASLALSQTTGWGVTRDGRTFCWGSDDSGSLGQGEGNWQRLPLKQPKEHAGLPPVKAVSAGWKHTGAITTDGRLLTWGWCGAYVNDANAGAGQLGLGDEYDHWAPGQVQRLHTSAERFYDLRMSYIKPWKVLGMSCGRNHTAMVVQVELDMRDVAL